MSTQSDCLPALKMKYANEITRYIQDKLDQFEEETGLNISDVHIDIIENFEIGRHSKSIVCETTLEIVI